MSMVLAVDKMGYPIKWIKPQVAVGYYAQDAVLWELGGPVATFRSGVSRSTGKMTVIEPSAIIGVDGQTIGRVPETTPSVASKNRGMLFVRDRWTCAYCGEIGSEERLSKDHIVPVSRGGPNTWMNVVTACKPCNHRKAAREPHEAGMALLYLPYVPSRQEGLILRNRKILADQMEFLMARVPKSSRLWD
jgi:hypothetical protein